jgi:hypothetical protein
VRATLPIALAAALLLPAQALAQAPSRTAQPQAAQSQATPAAAPTTGWRINPVRGPGGQTAYCLAEAKFSSNLVLAIARNPQGEVNLAIGIPQAGMTQGARFPLTITLDGKLRRRLEGVATDPQLLVVSTGPDTELYEALRRGSNLTIQGPQDTTAFQLKGTSKALADLRACAEGGGSGAKPGGGAGGGAAAAAGQPPRPEPMPPALRAVLARAGIQEVQVIDMQRVPPDRRPADFAWRVGQVLGGLREMQAPPDAGLPKLSESYLDGLRQRCQSTFTANPAPVETVGAVALRTAEATCAQPDGKTIAVSMLFYLTDTRLFTVFFHEAEEASRAQAQKIRDDIAGVIRGLAAAPPPTQQPPGGG